MLGRDLAYYKPASDREIAGYNKYNGIPGILLWRSKHLQ